MKQSLVDSIEKIKCTGCKMCGDICPNQAISFETDKKGFWYPVIDQERCTRCALCVKKCPALNQDQIIHMQEPDVYAAWSNSKENRHNSTSGGIFFEVAQLYLKKGGVVAGARYSDDYKSANHYLARNISELKQLRGSKYFQSDTEGIYKEIEKELKSGKEVLFCGTPCQNAALSMFLGDKYKNIFYMDFICRNINSPLAFASYISELEEKYKSKVIKVQLKNKKTGWKSLASLVCFANGNQSHQDRDRDEWMRGFLVHNLYTRDCCYDCKYRTLPRKAADITVGDFWGIEESPYDMMEGISVVMLNSEKAKKIFEEVKPNLIYKEKTLEEVIKGNPAMLNNPPQGKRSDVFFALLEKYSFSEAVNKCCEIKTNSKPNTIFGMFKESCEVAKKYKETCDVSKKKYIFYNYFCKNIVRYGEAKLVPEKNVVIDLHPNAKIRMYGEKDFVVGVSKLRKSKAETYIRMGRDAVWFLRHGGHMSYEAVLEVHDNGVLDTGFFSMNVRGTMIVDKKITLGEDVMMARNVIVYDSDFHQLLNDDGEQTNAPREVIIGNHVWLGANSTVLKGVKIGNHSVVAANALVSKDVPERALVAGTNSGFVINNSVNWKRDRCLKHDDLFERTKIILYGYGQMGKEFEKKYQNQIGYILDNRSKEEGVFSFLDFYEMYKEDSLVDEYVWVIASANYFEELYRQVRSKYPNMIVVAANE
ncbi:MAG: Coenzyme F420 hydrogenase/dehydrogenase, beta subunit C-terminal domain [Lachnospiraceae bacterium]|nr:Coenzyme F420 hydrogenase/dehydrogenase, beta subunit C-terminal domain [Lachnospiraceae bacterium]